MNNRLKTIIKKTVIYKIYKFFKIRSQHELSPEFKAANELIYGSNNMVDLGCGTSPHPKASVAVDKYIEPIHRKYGSNQKINIESFAARGIKFVEADFENLPFNDKEFDVAYSHHVVEHLDNPIKGLKEMQRIAQSGVIMCPSIFAEYMFSRQYHKWLIGYNGNTIIFIEKSWDNLWFGEGPHVENGKTVAPHNCNPFDILLNEHNWYHGVHRWRKLTKLMQKYWYGHHKIMENVFVWKDSFDYVVIWKDGRIDSSLKVQPDKF